MNKLRTFQSQNEKKVRAASLKQNLLVLIKKKCYANAKVIKIITLKVAKN